MTNEEKLARNFVVPLRKIRETKLHRYYLCFAYEKNQYRPNAPLLAEILKCDDLVESLNNLLLKHVDPGEYARYHFTIACRDVINPMLIPNINLIEKDGNWVIPSENDIENLPDEYTAYKKQYIRRKNFDEAFNPQRYTIIQNEQYLIVVSNFNWYITHLYIYKK